jgi:hypothetical protein
VALHARQVQQHREAGGPLDERPDRGAVETDDEVAFPVTRHCPVGNFCGPFTDEDLWGDELLASATCPSSRNAQRPPGSQARDEFTLQRAAPLDVERLVDGFVRDPHGLIIGEIEREPVRDLLGAPRPRPSTVRSPPVTSPDEPHVGARDQLAVGSSDLAGQALLHVRVQLVVAGELGDLRTAGAPLGMPLRGRCPIRQLVATRRRVPA